MPGICPRCKRPVFAAEERLALSGSSWHQECFTCAICNKSLDSTSVTENRENQEIYCKNCYRIHFAIQGYGYGPNKPTLVANMPPLEDCFDVTPTSSKATLFDARARSRPKVDANFAPPPSWKGLTYLTKHPRVKHYGHQVRTVPRQLSMCTEAESAGPTMPASAIVKSTPRPEPRSYGGACSRNRNDNCDTERPMTSPATYPRAFSRPPPPMQKCNSSNSACSSSCGMNQRPDICPKCGKPVYFNERRFGYHGVYHPWCFVCTCCGRSLDATTVCESNGQLFCKGCYKRYIATEGVGFGVGAGTLQTH